METPARQPLVAIFTSPGTGHRIPALDLAKRLVSQHAVSVTLFFVTLPTTSPDELQLLRIPHAPPYRDLLRAVALPPVDISDLVPSDASMVTQIIVSMREACTALRSSLSALDAPPTALIADFFGFDGCAVAHDLGIPAYIYFPGSAWFLVLTCWLPILDMEVEGEYVAQKEPLRLPGCRSVRPEDVIEPMMDRSDQQYGEYVRLGAGIVKADGFILNTWDELEPQTFLALMENEALRKLVHAPLYPLGPLARAVEPENLMCELGDWLDRQPAGSVIFVSFGSGGRLSAEQTEEMAWGLERSRHRFVWAVRAPAVIDGGEAPVEYLPEGFSDRTGRVGRLVSGWATQREILEHPSVGGFLSHCGWNSSVESISSGVPMIAWPLRAEQMMNATLLVEEIGVALRPKGLPSPSSAAVVGRAEIERVVEALMAEDSEEGEAVRKKAAELRCRAAAALAGGGCCDDMLRRFVDTCRNGVTGTPV